MATTFDHLVEVKLANPEDFLKVKETLTRIGIASRRDNTLFQSCHILHKRGKYAIVHFKEMFLLDGKESNFTDEDKGRRNKIINLLVEWDLIEVVDPDQIKEPIAELNQIKIVPFALLLEWNLVSKYAIGKKSNAVGRVASSGPSK